MIPERLTITVREAATALGVSPGLLYRLIRDPDGTFPHRKIGGRIVILRDEFNEYVNASPASAPR